MCPVPGCKLVYSHSEPIHPGQVQRQGVGGGYQGGGAEGDDGQVHADADRLGPLEPPSALPAVSISDQRLT